MPVVTVVPIDHEKSTSRPSAGIHDVLSASPTATSDEMAIAIGVMNLTRNGENTRENSRPEMSAPRPLALNRMPTRKSYSGSPSCSTA